MGNRIRRVVELITLDGQPTPPPRLALTLPGWAASSCSESPPVALSPPVFALPSQVAAKQPVAFGFRMSPQVSSGSPLLAVADRLKRILSRAASGSDTLDEFAAKPLAKRTVSRASSSGRLDSFPAQPQAFLYKLLSSQFCVIYVCRAARSHPPKCYHQGTCVDSIAY